MPSDERLVGTSKLLFALLELKSLFVHTSRQFGDECNDLLTHFNNQLWPHIALNSEMVAKVRTFYSSVCASLKVVAKHALYSNAASTVKVFHAVVFNLSSQPLSHFNIFAINLLKNDDKFFEAALKYLLATGKFDSLPFYQFALNRFEDAEELDPAERDDLKTQVTLLRTACGSLSQTQYQFLNLLDFSFL